MPTFKHMIRTAQTRELINRVLARGGFGLLMGLSAGLILLMLDRFTGSVQIDWPVYAAAGFAGFGIGAIQAFITRADAMTMAVYLDRALKLKDRIGTIEALDSQSRVQESEAKQASFDPEFAALLRADAARLAAGIHVSAVTPIQFRPAWVGSLVLAALLWAGVNFLPEVASADTGDSESPAGSMAQLKQREQAVNELQQTIQNATEDLPRNLAGDEHVQSRLDALDRLAEQLSSDTPLDERELASTRDETAAAMDDLADQLTEQAERDRAAAEELQRRFASMDQQQRPEPPMSAREFSEALQRGDFGQAARSLEELLNNAEAFTEDEKAAMASHLRELGKHIQQSQAAQPDPRIDERKQQAEDALRNLGVDDDQTLQELLDPDASRLQEELEQTLRENNIDQELARKLARELRELNRQQQVDEQVRDEARDLAETLNRAADDLQAPPPNPQTSPPQPPQPQPPQPPQIQPQSAKDQQNQSQEPEKPRQQQQPEERNQNEQQGGNTQESQQQQDSQSKQQQSAKGDQRSAESKQQGGQRKESSRKQGEQEREGAQQEQGEQTQQGEQQPQREGQQKPAGDSSKQREAQRQPGSQRDSPESGRPQPSPAQPGEQTTGQPAPSPDPDSGQQSDSTQQRQAQKQPGQASGEQFERQPASPQDQAEDLQSQPSDEFDPSKVDPETLQEMLKRLAERPRNAQDKQQISERMRQRARELADNMSPEQRRQWAEALQREMGEQESGQQAHESEQDSEHEARNDPNQPAIIQQPHTSNGSAGTSRGTEQANRQRQQPSTLPERSTEDLNLTGDETADKLIAQWLSDQQQLEPSPAGGPGDAAAPAPIRRAQELAERAVNDAAVHRRYHQAIKRYFGRLDRTVRKAAEQKNTQSTPRANPGQGGQGGQ